MNKGEIVFAGRTGSDEVLKENSIPFEISPISNDEGKQRFKVEMLLTMLNTFEIYDIYFKAHYEEYSDYFRINKDCIGNIINESEDVKVLMTSRNNLSVYTQLLSDVFEFDCNEKELRILVANGNKIKKNLNVFVKNVLTKEKTQLSLNEDKNAYELKWKFFLDKRSKYSIHLTVYDDVGRINKNIRLTERNLKDFDAFFIKTEIDYEVKVYKTEYGNIRLRSLVENHNT
jgi:hypothetical protein